MGIELFNKSQYDLVTDSYTDFFPNNNTITTFKSIENILYLIYSNMKKSIILYNIIDNKKINEIKNAHKRYIINFNHHLDSFKKCDFVLSISLDSNLKLWNINICECLLNIKKKTILYSACFLVDNYQTYIITEELFIKVHNLNGDIIKEISEPKEITHIIECYYDKKLSKCFILTGNENNVISIDYNNKKLYHKYCIEDEEKEFPHNSFFIYDKDNLVKLFESTYDGLIRIWDFHTGKFLKKIKAIQRIREANNLRNLSINILSSFLFVTPNPLSSLKNLYSSKEIEEGLFGICLWNNKYLLAACKNNIKFIDIQNGEIAKEIDENNVMTIQKIFHTKFGECFISQGYHNSTIKLWMD